MLSADTGGLSYYVVSWYRRSVLLVSWHRQTVMYVLNWHRWTLFCCQLASMAALPCCQLHWQTQCPTMLSADTGGMSYYQCCQLAVFLTLEGRVVDLCFSGST